MARRKSNVHITWSWLEESAAAFFNLLAFDKSLDFSFQSPSTKFWSETSAWSPLLEYFVERQNTIKNWGEEIVSK